MEKLSADFHVWICNSPINTPKVKETWEKSPSVEYSQGKGVTSFDLSGSPLETFYEFLPTLDEHHSGDGMEFLEWSKINVLGISESLVSLENIEKELGFKVSIQSSTGMFIITRQQLTKG